MMRPKDLRPHCVKKSASATFTMFVVVTPVEMKSRGSDCHSGIGLRRFIAFIARYRVSSSSGSVMLMWSGVKSTSMTCEKEKNHAVSRLLAVNESPMARRIMRKVSSHEASPRHVHTMATMKMEQLICNSSMSQPFNCDRGHSMHDRMGWREMTYSGRHFEMVIYVLGSKPDISNLL